MYDELGRRIDDYFASASDEEVLALLDRCGLDRYKGSIGVTEYFRWQDTASIGTKHGDAVKAAEDQVVAKAIAFLQQVPGLEHNIAGRKQIRAVHYSISTSVTS